MKRIGIIQTSALVLLLGFGFPADARQDKPDKQVSAIETLMVKKPKVLLVSPVSEAVADTIESGLRARMSAAADLRVPLKVEVGRGGNWDEAH